ncbi:DUF302 domain-containing protein [Pseudodonghicola flavimaris]|uniref:DUF302 domain-containing protein n=1 Tax=Pseudodonghicola flavimaris TaxID=3050036 RepID=A0ABT7EZG6_9RHOB|nr:DUF302 domain-containing protein [Pseudodonghicola flavimaris]MDK3017639.1 DUF302 domain-containing protein [Pseudodonghicola flavimaris]
MTRFIIAAALGLAAQMAVAQEKTDQMVRYGTDQSFEDVAFGVESAILDAGLVVDHISHVGEMLERTRADVGSDKVLFTKADVYSFCSATVSRSVMEADPMNIVYCPYDIFVAELAETPGTVFVGYRQFPDGPMQEVQQMLDGIVKSALGD